MLLLSASLLALSVAATSAGATPYSSPGTYDFVVPTSGFWSVVADGGQGQAVLHGGGQGGLGASVGEILHFTAGTDLTLSVGGSDAPLGPGDDSGSGGDSSRVMLGSTPIAVAGGGGGAFKASNGGGGQSGTAGGAGVGGSVPFGGHAYGGAGGTSGSGGGGGTLLLNHGYNYGGGGGGGIRSAGVGDSTTDYSGRGGGIGGGGLPGWYGGGGGGGYSGGGAGAWGAGGGGGSFLTSGYSAYNQVLTAAAHAGFGYIGLTLVSADSTGSTDAPEPASFAVLATGLAGAGLARRKKPGT